MMGFFSDSDVSIFITVIIMVAADFWITKNITGRLLVGLRWWTHADFADYIEEGDDEADDEDGWFFESFDYEAPSTTFDRHIFWWGLIFSTSFWCIWCVIKALGLSVFWVIF